MVQLPLRLVLFSLLVQSITVQASRQLLDSDSCKELSISELAPVITKNPVIDLQWLDAEDKYVIAVTKKPRVESGGVWLSQDGGSQWTELTPTLQSTSVGDVEVVMVLAQKSNPQNVMLLGANDTYWISQDSGKTMKAYSTPTKWKGGSIKMAKVHPTKDNWLLILVKRPDCKKLDRTTSDCPYDLMVNQDVFSSSNSWVNLTASSNGAIAGFVDFDWGVNLCAKRDCPFSLKDELIFATMYKNAGDYDQPWDPDVHFITSSDWFKSSRVAATCGNMFEIIGQTIYLAFANGCPTDITGKSRSADKFPSGITLYTSIDGGNSFTQACLPVALKQEGYELLETHDGTGAIVIVDFLVNNGFMDIPASSVYTAGPHHALFSLSMTNVFRSERMGLSTDFARIEGLPGVYITNMWYQRATSDDYYYDLSDSSDRPLVESRITFNGGGKWQRIPAPKEFRNAACNRCGGQSECFLHLHGMSAWESATTDMPAVYSNPSAPGLIMATGNVGPMGVGLDDAADGLCTWLSIDGGATWSDVAVGAYIYEFADWGGVIIMAKHSGRLGSPADHVLYSLDYGHCWQKVPLQKAMLIDNIRIEPDGQRPRVVVHGRQCRTTASPKCSYNETQNDNLSWGIMYLVDVTEIQGASNVKQCAGTEYEKWSIPDDNGAARCVLGKQTKYTRRKQNSACLNGAAYKRPEPVGVICQCSMNDVECDYGWAKAPNGECKSLTKTSMPQCPVVDNGIYAVSATGKRIVHADVCTGIDAIINDTDGQGKSTQGGGSGGGTPSDGGGSSGGNTPAGGGGGGGGSGGNTPASGGGQKKHHSGAFGFFMFLLVAIVLSGCFVAWWKFLATEMHKDMVRDVVASATNFFTSLYQWVVDKIRGRRGDYDQDMAYFQPLGDSTDPDGNDRNIFTIK